MDFGQNVFQDFINERFELNTASIFGTISSEFVADDPIVTLPKSPKKETSKDVENNKATRYLEYALFRGKSQEYMLQFPLTSRPFFLDRDGSETKHPDNINKAQLANEFLKKIGKDDIKVAD